MSDTHARTVDYVRETAIPAAPPPAAEKGAVKWLRENLFSSVANVIMTLAAIVVIYLLLAAVLPWILNGVWIADSVRECYDKLDGARGGCFAVLVERWHQFLFGRYPQALYWRPVLALVLFGVAAAPVLFTEVSRRLLWFTLVFPFVAQWLIWGGSLWGSMLALGGLAVGYLVFRAMLGRSFLGAVAAGLAVAVVIWTVLVGPLTQALGGVVPLEIDPVRSRDVGGFMLNFILGATCISLSLPIGIALALGRQSWLPIIKTFSVLFIEFIRGVPLITLLFVANVMLAYFLPPGSSFALVIRVVIMITMFASAYIAEVIRGALAALPRGQHEAADALGLDYWQAMRLIILPQALKISIPGIVNITLALFKDTTLVSIIAMFDLVGMIRGPILTSTDWSGVYWEVYGFAALIFFVVCFSISQYSQYLERRLETDAH